MVLQRDAQWGRRVKSDADGPGKPVRSLNRWTTHDSFFCTLDKIWVNTGKGWDLVGMRKSCIGTHTINTNLFNEKKELQQTDARSL
jgi:hypothetical protein